MSKNPLTRKLVAWGQQEVARINLLPENELLTEFHDIITGKAYSWRTIGLQLKQAQLSLDLYREWSILCDVKRNWEITHASCVSQPFDADAVLASLIHDNLWKRRAYQVTLNNLKILPLYAGLGAEGK